MSKRIPFVSKVCPRCGIDKPRADFIPEVSTRNQPGKVCRGCIRFIRNVSLGERFWVNVRATDTCWLWSGRPGGTGYGHMGVGGKPAIASRLAWELCFGPIPDGLFVLHSCDTPLCVRPDHLFLGTQSDNMRDCARKKRLGQQKDPARWCWGPTHPFLQHPETKPRGEHHWNAHLTEIGVREMRRRHASGEMSIRQLAVLFGISHGAVWHILQRRRWRHVDD